MSLSSRKGPVPDGALAPRPVDDEAGAQDRVAGAQLPRQRWKTNLVAVVLVDDDVDSPHNVEGDDKQPKERTHPCAEECEHGQ